IPIGTYEQTYRGIIQQQLTSYMKALQSAFQQVKGPKGQSLLKDDYKQAQLLQIQLNQPAG
ncbi:MAG TPA: hypothetical protein VHA37_09400, partial [Candidatus Saccharimonadales bacterium]|nr:hypothetical protein [Candidatus Saccharimonadales bacterium]